MVVFCLDGFKPVKDQYGLDGGGVVLREVSDRLAEIVRGVDTVARLGGDEFAIILQGVSRDREILDVILKKILKVVAEPITIDSHDVSVGASLGVAFYQTGCSLSDLCKQADIAMYDAKQTKNTWRAYSKGDTSPRVR